MSTLPIALDISHNKDLLQLAEEVQKTKTPRALIKDNETVALIMPVAAESSTQKQHKEEVFNAMLSVLGSWRDWDTDTMIKHIYQAREAGSRPPTRP